MSNYTMIDHPENGRSDFLPDDYKANLSSLITAHFPLNFDDSVSGRSPIARFITRSQKPR